MPIRWKTMPIWEALDRIDALLDQVEPLLVRASQEAVDAAQLPDLPQYIRDPLRSLEFEGKRLVKHYREGTQRLRGAIPAEALERERARPVGLF